MAEKSVMNRGLINTLGYATALALMAFVLFKTVPEFSFFSLHPICMIISYGYVMFQGVLFFSPWFKFASKRESKITLHWIFQVTALAISFIGIVVAVYNKFLLKKNHFVSWHSWLGLALFVFTIVECIGGILAKYPLITKGYLHPRTMKTMHAFSACSAFLLMAITLVTGLNSNYFTNLTKETPSLWKIVFAAPFYIAFVVLGQALQSYVPLFRSIKQIK